MLNSLPSVAEARQEVNQVDYLGEWVVVLAMAPKPEPRMDVVEFLRQSQPQLTAEDLAQLRKEGWL